MSKLLVKLIRNKANGQINLNIPKKQLDMDIKKKIDKSKKVWINFGEFE